MTLSHIKMETVLLSIAILIIYPQLMSIQENTAVKSCANAPKHIAKMVCRVTRNAKLATKISGRPERCHTIVLFPHLIRRQYGKLE